MLKEFFKKPEQLVEYNLHVEIFNNNNPFKIGEKIFIQLTEFYEVVNVRIVEVKVELALYGLADEEEPFKYEFQPIFIIGDSPIPEKGEEYGERIFWTDFSLKSNSKRLPNSNYIRFNKIKYDILDEQDIM
jgi:hypothetical protein